MKVEYSKQFRKEYRVATKRNKDMQLIHHVIDMLMAGQTLHAKYRDHAMTGPFLGYRECHIEPDWLLVYKIQGDILFLHRTGSHSDLF